MSGLALLVELVGANEKKMQVPSWVALVESGDADLVRTVDVNTPWVRLAGDLVWTPLGLAVELRFVRVARVLLELGARVNDRHKRWTPLGMAVHLEHLALCELLLQAGADTEAEFKWSPEHLFPRWRVRVACASSQD